MENRLLKRAAPFETLDSNNKTCRFSICDTFADNLHVVLEAIDEGVGKTSPLIKKINPHSDWNRFLHNVFSPHQCNVSCHGIKQIFTNVFPGTTSHLLPIIHLPLATYNVVVVCLHKADVAAVQNAILEQSNVFVSFVTPMKTIRKVHHKEWLTFWEKLIDYIADNRSASVTPTLYICGRNGSTKKNRIVYVNSVHRLATIICQRNHHGNV